MCLLPPAEISNGLPFPFMLTGEVGEPGARPHHTCPCCPRTLPAWAGYKLFSRCHRETSKWMPRDCGLTCALETLHSPRAWQSRTFTSTDEANSKRFLEC